MARPRKQTVPLEPEQPGELFEVKRDGATKFRTEYPSCYPDRERRDQLRRAGYKLYLGSKMYRESKA